ncbi:LuxR family transcriptional regulator [Georgenia sp. SYP-B2076]|uniref:helix-turn-helix transcriptional regulator n=1 Tax=Georgenia sp. SYP-B2076 TaxID=2495881 RepID=UPI000F8D04F2|nr:LuxR family transcriptional regulator [Georgenia sp. SYP-B2076]
MFETLGLDANAIAVYRTLLSSPGATHPQLVERTGLGHDEVHALIDVLEERGFLRRGHTDPTDLRTESPQVAFERLLGQQEEKLHREQEQLSAIRSGAAELIDEYQRAVNRRIGAVEHLTGVDEIVSRLRELSQNVSNTLDSVITMAPTPHMLAQAKTDEEPFLARGIKNRSIYPAAARHAEGVPEYAAWLAERGAAARTSITVPNRILIYDGEVAVLNFDPEDYWRGAVIVNTPGVVATLRALFELLWEGGTDLAPTAADEDQLRPEERELLQLLARGMKDEAIARQLGISIRTVRRMINTLSSRMGTASRFALGVRAAQLGCL